MRIKGADFWQWKVFERADRITPANAEKAENKLRWKPSKLRLKNHVFGLVRSVSPEGEGVRYELLGMDGYPFSVFVVGSSALPRGQLVGLGNVRKGRDFLFKARRVFVPEIPFCENEEPPPKDYYAFLFASRDTLRLEKFIGRFLSVLRKSKGRIINFFPLACEAEGDSLVFKLQINFCSSHSILTEIGKINVPAQVDLSIGTREIPGFPSSSPR